MMSSPASAPSTRRARAARWFGRCFYACGATGIPEQISCLGDRYVLERVFKHDFFAASALYRREAETTGSHDGPDRIVCKMGRRMHFCLIPLGWFGRLITHSEVRNLGRCEGIPEVPRILARLSPNSYAYGYIEGTSLHDRPPLPKDYFDRLLAALRQIHARNVVHFDLHKPGNILVDADGRPHIIDFQVSRHIGDRALLSKWLSRRLRRWLQSYDTYHLCKHKRKLQPELLTPEEERLSRNRSLALRIHRAIAGPYKRIRRTCLRYLHARGVLIAPDHDESPETNPARWAK
ncbi:MAG: hypothetical protein ABFE01_23580 [Phycisphaerales bacterium]